MIRLTGVLHTYIFGCLGTKLQAVTGSQLERPCQGIAAALLMRKESRLARASIREWCLTC